MYNFFIWLSLIPYIIGYFRLICIQIKDLLGYDSYLIAPIVCAALLAAIIVLRNFHFWEEFLAYGIGSIAIYVIFLIWAHLTSPPGPYVVKVSGDPFILASILVGAFATHSFLPQNLIKNPRRH